MLHWIQWNPFTGENELYSRWDESTREIDLIFFPKFGNCYREVDVLNLDENLICMIPEILLKYTLIYSFGQTFVIG